MLNAQVSGNCCPYDGCIRVCTHLGQSLETGTELWPSLLRALHEEWMPQDVTLSPWQPRALSLLSSTPFSPDLCVIKLCRKDLRGYLHCISETRMFGLGGHAAKNVLRMPLLFSSCVICIQLDKSEPTLHCVAHGSRVHHFIQPSPL